MSAEAARTGEGAQAAGYLLPELGHPDIALVSVAVRRHREAPGEPQVIVLALQQAARQRVMLAAQRDGAVPGLADPGQSGGTVTGGPLGEGGRVYPIPAPGDRLCTSARIVVSASAARVAQHHPPAGAPPVTACSSRSACAQHPTRSNHQWRLPY